MLKRLLFAIFTAVITVLVEVLRAPRPRSAR